MDTSNRSEKMSQPLPDGLTSPHPHAADLSRSVHSVFDAQFMGPLADNSSTTRLLNALSKLEAFHANLSAATGVAKTSLSKENASGTAITAELSYLRVQNKKLKSSQKMAISRLDDLLARLPGLAAVENSDDTANNPANNSITQPTTEDAA